MLKITNAKVGKTVLFVGITMLMIISLNLSYAEALESKGTPNPSVRSPLICGLELCSVVGMDKPEPPRDVRNCGICGTIV